MTSRFLSRVPCGLAIVAVVFLAEPARSQKPAGGGAGAGASTGGTAGKTAPSTTTNNTTGTTYPPDAFSRGLFLSGKVRMEDGTAPPEPVAIERVCNGYVRAEAYTDSKGNFSFQMGQNNSIPQDAAYDSLDPNRITQSSGLPQKTAANGQGGASAARPAFTHQDLTGCDIRASLAGFRSDAVNLGGRRQLDNPDLGVIILHRMANVEGTTISATTLAAPKDARKAYDKAREALRKGKTNEAETEFDKAVAAYPQFAAAWNSLGLIHEQNKEWADARRCFSQALVADPKLLTPYMHLAAQSAEEKNWPEVEATTARLIRLDPYDFPEAYFFNGVAAYNLQKYDEALASAREAQKLDTARRFPRVEYLLGIILYRKKDYAGAAEQMRKYLALAPDAPDAATARQQLAELERFLLAQGKTAAASPTQ